MPIVNTTSLLVVTSASSTDLLATKALKLLSVRWFGATTAGHGCVLKDGSDNTLWQSVAGGANYVEESDLQHKVPPGARGFKVTTLGSGTVHLYYKELNK